MEKNKTVAKLPSLLSNYIGNYYDIEDLYQKITVKKLLINYYTHNVHAG
jgi:hypothetical protein